MSTTFDVFPKNCFIPSFEELFDKASVNLNNYLNDIGSNHKYEITFQQLNISDNAVIESATPESFYLTNPEHYLWIQLSGIEGGIECYYDLAGEEILAELIEGQHITKQKAKEIKLSLNQDYYWWFCRSAGQPQIVNLFYGILAGTLAELTEGMVFSGDCAWEYEALPSKGNDFLEIYMKPEKVLHDVEFKDFASDCIYELTHNTLSF